MNITDYKASLLAREDIDDIVMIEPIDVRKIGETFEQIEYNLESGRTMRVYDIHVVGLQKDQRNRFTIPVAVYDQGLDGEEVVELRQRVEKEVSESQIETYLNGLPFVDIQNLQVDREKLTARFDAIEVTGQNAGREVKVFAYKPDSKPPTYLILE